jgi:hypothetical protein
MVDAKGPGPKGSEFDAACFTTPRAPLSLSPIGPRAAIRDPGPARMAYPEELRHGGHMEGVSWS